MNWRGVRQATDGRAGPRAAVRGGVLAELADGCLPKRLKLAADKVGCRVRQWLLVVVRGHVDQRAGGADEVPRQPARQDVAQGDKRPGHAGDPLEEQLLAVPVGHRPHGDKLVERAVEGTADRRRAAREAGHRVLAQGHQVQAARGAEDGLDVVEERLGAVAVADLVDLVDPDDHAPFPAVGGPLPGGHPPAVGAEAVHQLRQGDRLLGALLRIPPCEGQEDLGVSDADQLAVYVRRYLSCSRWRRVSAAIADLSAGPCGTASHSWLNR